MVAFHPRSGRIECHAALERRRRSSSRERHALVFSLRQCSVFGVCVAMSGADGAEVEATAVDVESSQDQHDLWVRWADTSRALAAAVSERDAALRALAELRQEVAETVASVQALTDQRVGDERRQAADVKAKYKRRVADLEARCAAADKRVAESSQSCRVQAEEAASALDRVSALQSALSAAEAASRSAVACAEAECVAKSESVQRQLRDKCAQQLRELTVEVDAWRAFVARVGAARGVRVEKEHAELAVTREALRAAEERASAAGSEVALANASADAARARAADAEQDAAYMREAVVSLLRRCGLNPSELLAPGQLSTHALTHALNAALSAATRAAVTPVEARLAQADAESTALRAAVESARTGQARSDSRCAALAEQLSTALDALRKDMAQLEAARQQEADESAVAMSRVAMERDLAVQQVASLRRSLAEMAAGQSMATVATATPGQMASTPLLERAMQSLLVS